MTPTPLPSAKRKPEYLVALGLAAGPVVALGFTRFAYALLLPAMRQQLHWSYPALVSVVVLVGVLPVLLWHGMGAAIASAVVFGGSFMAGPTAVTVLARRMLPAHAWTAGIALLTVAFSVGQAVGPLVSGLLSDSSGGIAKGLWLSVVLLGASIAAAVVQRDPGTAGQTDQHTPVPAVRSVDRY
ncbi:YbfB/YjiJ family MFS transporter [Peterkaempfera sp. SMS 1(5)a]|uniref:YbfB/YjiJ family MFS transporter n=1 Tax=Peterkaempfera podocarpi TaxID=3232308 RepID=UPI00366A9FD0